jgi:hypothetical protein
MCVPKPWPTVGDESHLSFQETFALVGTADGTISVKIVRSQIELRLSCVVHMGIRTCDMVVHGVSCVLR